MLSSQWQTLINIYFPKMVLRLLLVILFPFWCSATATEKWYLFLFLLCVFAIGNHNHCWEAPTNPPTHTTHTPPSLLRPMVKFWTPIKSIHYPSTSIHQPSIKFCILLGPKRNNNIPYHAGNWLDCAKSGTKSPAYVYAAIGNGQARLRYDRIRIHRGYSLGNTDTGVLR